jgi:fatty-acid desaturase
VHKQNVEGTQEMTGGEWMTYRKNPPTHPSRNTFIPLFSMRRLLVALLIAAVFGGGWGFLYFILS